MRRTKGQPSSVIQELGSSKDFSRKQKVSGMKVIPEGGCGQELMAPTSVLPSCRAVGSLILSAQAEKLVPQTA